MLLALALLAAAGLPPKTTPFSDDRPPARFQGAVTVQLEVSDQARIDKICHPLFGTPPAGMKTDACQTGDRVIMPNPCSFPQTETYARMLCHELGHANGWPSTHGDPPEGPQHAGGKPASGARSRQAD